MEKRELVKILNEVFVPLGFKKKEDNWIINGDEIIKMVNLQKSKFSNSFYINYGYILKTIPLNGLAMHVFKGFGSIDNTEQQRIVALLNLEKDVSKADREGELKKYLFEKLVLDINKVNTEEDVLNELKQRSCLNDVPLILKKYFRLEE